MHERNLWRAAFAELAGKAQGTQLAYDVTATWQNIEKRLVEDEEARGVTPPPASTPAPASSGFFVVPEQYKRESVVGWIVPDATPAQDDDRALAEIQTPSAPSGPVFIIPDAVDLKDAS